MCEVETGYHGNKNFNGKGLLPIKRVDRADARLLHDCEL